MSDSEEREGGTKTNGSEPRNLPFLPNSFPSCFNGLHVIVIASFAKGPTQNTNTTIQLFLAAENDSSSAHWLSDDDDDNGDHHNPGLLLLNSNTCISTADSSSRTHTEEYHMSGALSLPLSGRVLERHETTWNCTIFSFLLNPLFPLSIPPLLKFLPILSHLIPISKVCLNLSSCTSLSLLRPPSALLPVHPCLPWPAQPALLPFSIRPVTGFNRALSLLTHFLLEFLPRFQFPHQCHNIPPFPPTYVYQSREVSFFDVVQY